MTSLNLSLQTIMAADQPSSHLLNYAIGEMRRWCREAAVLPRSCVLDHSIALKVIDLVSSTGLSDVYRGTYGGVVVAIKYLRVGAEDMDAVTRASALVCYCPSALD
jgi:hypothetical protein